MSVNEFSPGEKLELGNNFSVAVGDHVHVGTLKTAIAACENKKSVRLFTPDKAYDPVAGGFNPMRTNIHVDTNRYVTRIHFG